MYKFMFYFISGINKLIICRHPDSLSPKAVYLPITISSVPGVSLKRLAAEYSWRHSGAGAGGPRPRLHLGRSDAARR